MTRDEMATVIIRLYGFENENTIQFFELMERLPENEWNNAVLESLVKAHLKNPILVRVEDFENILFS